MLIAFTVSRTEISILPSVEVFFIFLNIICIVFVFTGANYLGKYIFYIMNYFRY